VWRDSSVINPTKCIDWSKSSFFLCSWSIVNLLDNQCVGEGFLVLFTLLNSI
jgi:hypothetical protein